MDFITITTHPAFGNFAFIALSLWPLARLFIRNAQSPWLASLLLLNLVLPFLGIIAAAAALLARRTPKAPA